MFLKPETEPRKSRKKPISWEQICAVALACLLLLILRIGSTKPYGSGVCLFVCTLRPSRACAVLRLAPPSVVHNLPSVCYSVRLSSSGESDDLISLILNCGSKDTFFSEDF